MPEDPSAPTATLTVVCTALAGSALVASIGAWLLAPQGGAPDRLGPLALWVLVVLALVPMVVAPAVERALPATASVRGADTGRAATQAKILGFALREVTALLGALVTLLTGHRLFVALLGGFALLGMLLAWPTSVGSDSSEPR